MTGRLRRLRWLPLAVLLLALMGARSSCSAGMSYGSVGHHRERAYARRIFGNDSAEQHCLVALWDQESGWNPDALEDQPIGGNAPTYAAGIPQANPADFGHPFALGDWRAQIRWGRWYIDSRYGSPCAAEAHEQADNWY